MRMQKTFRNDLAASGQFIEMDQAGRLETVSGLIQKQTLLAAHLSQVQEKLRACNDCSALSEYAVWCITKKKSFGPELRKMVEKLETRKSELQKEMQQIEGELAR